MRLLLSLLATASLVAVGLTAAAPPAAAAAAVSWSRVAGEDRFATSVEISRASDSWAGSTVYLANGLKFPDALAAGPVVAAERGHLLLTGPDALPASVEQRIRELQPAEIVVVGSEASVSAAVAQRARSISGAAITRLGGADRVGTSLLLLDRLRSLPGAAGVDTVWVASGFTFPDALVAASVAGRSNAAIVLDHHDGSSGGQRAWLDRVRPRIAGLDVHIAGGEPSVSAADAAALAVNARSVTRHAGSDRYQTARVINDAFPTSTSDPTMLLTTGQNFPDALAGAVHAALRGVPLYLSTTACHPQLAAMLAEEAAQRGISAVVGLGGRTSINEVALSLARCDRPVREVIAEQYGTFPEQRYSGSAPRRIDLGMGIPFASLHAFMSGEGVNRVVALDEAGDAIYEPISVEGSYYGTALLAAYREQPVRYLEVDSYGAWTVRVADLASAPELIDGPDAAGVFRDGRGDGVFLYDGDARSVRVQHEGGLFVVQELYERGDGFSVPFERCCEPFDADGALQSGPSVVAVVSDSNWRLTLR